MTIQDWKRSLYALLALPAYAAGPQARRWLAARLLGLTGSGSPPRPLAAGGLALLAWPFAVLTWFLVWRIATYGLFWDPAGAGSSWGGPSLIGAWIVHFFCALGMAVPAMWLLRPLTTAQAAAASMGETRRSTT
ncbi:hypothetical protein [Amycolatopsis sp. PS_44_ISF1]|uniref:hypothetical protein n=1 Tax=Amycolatopsis sp. PS_44_ISF1 TaxID=2974917 RepID=UPI0028DEAFEE|nr:hypothetical protein [Amycolatopsis sp. PS_44_ISF1]MDT8910476.1 hypothetical protein [Amycolatopsis sp. PS_44_ISF1]